jgi:hypothetical protein
MNGAVVNMIKIEGDLQTNKKRRELPPAVILTDTTKLIIRLADLRHAADRQHPSVAFNQLHYRWADESRSDLQRAQSKAGFDKLLVCFSTAL